MGKLVSLTTGILDANLPELDDGITIPVIGSTYPG